MNLARSPLPALLCATLPCFAQTASEALSTAHDGNWSVFLSCDETRDRYGKVYGYVYNFPVQIKGGRLDGRYDEKTSPAFVHFAGRVLGDGTLFIEADGTTGSPDATVNKVARGTPYRYTMKGKLQADRGKAQRIELRPCTADFTRSQ
jgi:hypothetical protein